MVKKVKMKNNNSKKGQAALEFLTTYGWAFIVILVMIGALSYFGVLNPKGLLPEKCLFEQPFNCVDYTADLTAGSPGSLSLSFYLRNNLGTSLKMKVADMNVTSPNYNGTAPTCTVDGVSSEKSLGANEEVEVVCKFNSIEDFPSSEGDKVRFFVKSTYKESNGKYYHPFTGELFVALQ